MSAPTVTQDPFDSASHAEPLKPIFYAQVNLDAWFCVLEKGQGKVVFDPAQHAIEKRCTAISISLGPIPEQTVQYPLTREMVAESKEWASIVWPSAKVLGINSTRELNGRWAKVEIVPSGRKYTNQQSGEVKDATTFKFLALYADEAAARQAYLNDTGRAGAADAAATPPTAAGAVAPTNGKEREAALAFLKVLVPNWISGGVDLDKVAQGITANPVIARHFTVDSPEVVALIAEHAK